MAGDYSPTQTVNVPVFDEMAPESVEYTYFLGEDPDENGWQESWTEQGPELTVWLMCKWEDRLNLIRALRGRVRPSAGGTSVDRLAPSFVLDPPFADADMAWNRFVCNSIGAHQRIKTRTMQEDDDVPGGLYSDEIVMPCNFDIPSYQTRNGVTDQGDPSGKWYTTTLYKPDGEMVCPPAGAYKFKDNPNVLVQDTQVGFYLGRTEMSITRHFMPYSGSDQMQYLIGCVNEFALKFPDVTYPAGTLLMSGIDPRPYVDPGSGKLVWDITYTCLVNAGKTGTGPAGGDAGKPIPWTQILNSQGVYAEIVNAQGDPPFASADFKFEIWPDV